VLLQTLLHYIKKKKGRHFWGVCNEQLQKCIHQPALFRLFEGPYVTAEWIFLTIYNEQLY